MSRRRHRNPTAGDAEFLVILAAVGIGGYLLYKGFAGLKASLCSITLPSWAGGSGESLFCATTNPDGTATPSALNTPTSQFDSSGSVVGAGGDDSGDTFLTDPYTTFNGMGCYLVVNGS